jgi:hypothetical protein
MKNVFLFLVLTALADVVLAAGAQRMFIHDDDLSAERVVEAVARVRAGLDSPGAPVLGEVEKSKLEHVLDQLVSLYRDDSPRRRSRAASLQQQANTILMPLIASNDSGNDMVCQRVFRVGTKIPSVECRTRAERAREQSEAAETISRMQTACGAGSTEPLCLGVR